MLVEELVEKLSFCEPDDEVKLLITDKGKYLEMGIDDIEVYDEYIAICSDGGE